eukprot:jgi/Bigna1/128062/aug1.5_g2770
MEELQNALRLYSVVNSIESDLRSICLESRKKGKGMFMQLKQAAEKVIVRLRGIHEQHAAFAQHKTNYLYRTNMLKENLDAIQKVGPSVGINAKLVVPISCVADKFCAALPDISSFKKHIWDVIIIQQASNAHNSIDRDTNYQYQYTEDGEKMTEGYMRIRLQYLDEEMKKKAFIFSQDALNTLRVTLLALNAMQRLLSIGAIVDTQPGIIIGTLRIQAETKHQGVQLKILQTLTLALTPVISAASANTIRLAAASAIPRPTSLPGEDMKGGGEHQPGVVKKHKIDLNTPKELQVSQIPRAARISDLVDTEGLETIMLQSLSICFRLLGVSTAAIYHTAFATLRQVFQKVPELGKNTSGEEAKLDKLPLEAKMAFKLFKDLCYLATAEGTKTEWLMVTQLRTAYEFPKVLRLVRIGTVLVREYRKRLISECEMLLSIFVRMYKALTFKTTAHPISCTYLPKYFSTLRLIKGAAREAAFFHLPR